MFGYKTVVGRFGIQLQRHVNNELGGARPQIFKLQNQPQNTLLLPGNLARNLVQ